MPFHWTFGITLSYTSSNAANEGIRRQLLRRGTVVWGLRGKEQIPLICHNDLATWQMKRYLGRL